ncbi:uncharacterized protein LOC132058410 [Lycium ferocissimum]|uniref:uncharacterized protein LOC132058410 n=1 Tax=Lycium ferocissimum TaxID=112874 RepID=UPI0028157F52|nr:uncharacterized protein LOC132058410 [Lycium ferocissimum]
MYCPPRGRSPSTSATLSPSPSPNGTPPSVSNLHLRDSSSEPESLPSNQSQTHLRPPAPAPAPVPAPIQAPIYHGLHPGDRDAMGRIFIVPEGVGFYPDHDTTKVLLDVVRRLYGYHFYTSWGEIPYDTRQAMFREFNVCILLYIS